MTDTGTRTVMEDGRILITDPMQLAMVCRIPTAYNAVGGAGLRIRIGRSREERAGQVQGPGNWNSNRAAGRFLFELGFAFPYALSELDGGDDLALLARETELLLLADGEDLAGIAAFAGQYANTLQQEYGDCGGQIYVEVIPEGIMEQPCLNPAALSRLTFFLLQLPDGVLKTDSRMPGLVESAVNAAVLHLNPRELYAAALIRDTLADRRQSVCDRLQYLCEFLGGECHLEDAEAEWILEADQEEAARELMRRLTETGGNEQ